MDETSRNCSAVPVANCGHPVWCSEEILIPFFTDVSLQVAMDSRHPPASHSTPPALPELRVVLLGRKGAGKSAAGNTILGGVLGFESGKPTEECVKRRADVAGRRLTVVDTPGWEWYYPLNGTPNWVKRETSRSVSLCPPGPHAVLLVVRACASVTEDYIGEMEDHLGPLGMGVWEHAMLLFTRGDELGLVSIEQRILSSGPALQRLLQNCGNRYHVMDNRSKGDGTQVKELIKKLEEMVERRQGGRSYLVMDNEILLGLDANGKRRARERRKKQRQMEEQMQRASIKAALMSEDPEGSQLDAHQSLAKAPRRLPEVRLVLLGERETGKSSAGNAILGEMVFFQVGAVTEECTRREAEVATRLLTVVDTPGWEGGVSGATPERVKREIVSSVALCPPGPHALLLTLRVDTLVKAGHVKEHLELLGEGVWRHTILLFTHGDQLREGVDIEQHIQGGGRDLQWLLEKCRGRYHVISSIDKSGRVHGDSCKVTDLLQEVENMAAMNRCDAFFGLSQEVRHLSWQRNKNFNQRLKEMGDKVIRQEKELRNMREREMKSIRWFFDRKKKVKSPEKANIQREEEEDRRNGERKNDSREVEERMRWLTEDKEREIQDLSMEKERIYLALNHSRREQDKAMLNLEVKEREIEELKERVEEQQMRLLDLERAGLEYEHERKKMEDAVKVRQQEWMSEVNKLKGYIEQQKKDEAEWMEKVDCLEREMEETKRQHEREAEEKNREMAEMEENMNIKLFEKEEEMEDLREKASEEMQAALTNAELLERTLERKVEEMKSQHKKEMERRTHEKEIEIHGMKLQHQEEMARQISQIENRMEMMTFQHQKEMDQKLKDNAEDLEKIKQQHDSEIRDMQQEKQRQTAELRRQFAKETEQQIQAGKKKIEDLEQRFLIQMEAKMQEKEEKENIYLNLIKDVKQKMDDKEEELQGFKLPHQEEMQAKIKEMKRLREEIKAELQEEMERKVKEKERDVERVQQECRDKIRDIEQERQTEVKELQQQFAEENEKQLKERQNMFNELEENYATLIKETALKIEQEKESMNKNHEEYILQKMEERDRLIQELKHQHFNEINDKMQQHDKEKEKIRMTLYEEKEQRLEEKENELERMKLSIKELKEKLQQREAKENKHLNYKENMEQMLEERAKEIQTIKEQLHEAEERERGHLNCSEEMEQKLVEKERLIVKLHEHVKDMNETLQRIEGERGEIILKHKKEMEKQLQDKEREMEEVKMQLLNEMQRKARDERKDAEMMEKLQREDEELHQLRQRDRENEKELLRLRLVIAQTKSELMELTSKMEKEMASMIEEYEREIARRNEGAESIARERDRLEEESRQRLSEVTEKWEESRRRVDLLQEQNREMRKEADDVLLKYEELKKTSEGEVRKHLEGYERQAKSVEAEIRSILKERDVEVRLLMEANVKLKAEIVRMTERGGEAGRRPKERQFRSEDKEIGEEFSKRDKDLTGNEELAKEEELVEKELESLFTALEGKQIELNHHCPDLQKKDHRKELEDMQMNSRAPQSDETARDSALLREELHGEEEKLKVPFKKPSKWEGSLAEREEELLQREKTSQENENERMDDLPLVTQEVQSKEEGEKGRDRDRDRGGIAKERADQRMKTALSSAESNNHKLKATEVAAGRDRMRETKEREDLEEAEVSHDFKFLSASQGSKDAESAGSELRVMVLGEPWSSRSPAGVTVLGGEVPEHDGRSFRHWRGRVEGRRLALVEPLGLRWRDGPDPTDAMQKKSILDSLSRCRPGPHAVLLLVPAFLTCTRKYRRAVEEHVRLLGEGIWQRTLVLFTWGEVLGESAEQHVRRNGELMRLVERCGGGFHVVTSRKSNAMIEGLFQKMRDMIGFEQCVNL